MPYDVRLAVKAYELRKDVIDMVYHAGSGHPGGSLSSAEILTALYWKIMKIDPENPRWALRDRFILSKGHAAPIHYAALAHKGFYDRAVLATLRRLGSSLQGHPDRRKTPGVDMSSGSLGQGLSIGLGMALGSRRADKPFSVYVLLSDGELQEGMVWEAAMASGHFRVDNLTAIVDANNLQVDGPVSSVMAVEPLLGKWRSFGWDAVEVDGHSITQIVEAVSRPRDNRPLAVICRTVKGKGVSYMENVMEWHASPISRELREIAISELDSAIAKLYSKSTGFHEVSPGTQ